MPITMIALLALDVTAHSSIDTGATMPSTIANPRHVLTARPLLDMMQARNTIMAKITLLRNFQGPDGRGLSCFFLKRPCGTSEGEKTVAARNIALSFQSDTDKGQQFLTTCRAIQEMLTATEAWNDLPEYEHLYE